MAVGGLQRVEVGLTEQRHALPAHGAVGAPDQAEPGRQVGTVGQMRAEPGAPTQPPVSSMPTGTPDPNDFVGQLTMGRARLESGDVDGAIGFFERAKALEDQSQMSALDFSYRREQLYFEILLDIRDAMERR